MGQKKSIVTLIQSERSVSLKMNGRDVIKVYKGVFKQDFSTLRSDSAYFYYKENAFDAFSNVNINQGDTLNIYSDKLNYNGNTKIAILTDNVKMVDRDATLTTNYLTYNTATRIGTYTSGGKLINKDNVLTSKNGYYFANSRDSYFRYDVVLTTIDALIKTDTLRYNTGTRISYFLGPSNIYGKKDNDTLYTENGQYNTVVEQAAFGKHNLYKQGTKSLKGDSLFYDKLKGYGRAVKNITFIDREQKITLKGDLGTYFRADERTVVTQYAYVVMTTEEKDTTKIDSVPPPAQLAKNKELKPPPNTMPVTNLSKMVQDLKPKGVVIAKKDSVKADSTIKALSEQAKNMSTDEITNMAKMGQALLPKGTISNKDSAQVNSAIKELAKQGKNKPADAAKITNMAKLGEAIKPKKGANTAAVTTSTTAKPAEKVKRDSIYMTADTLETQIMTYKNLKAYQEKQRAFRYVDTSEAGKKAAALAAIKKKPTSSKFLVAVRPRMQMDTTYLHKLFFGKPKPVNDSLQRKKDALAAVKKAKQDSVARVARQNDPVFATHEIKLADTARVRILIAHHNVKIFKSDLQGKSDSLFYSASDSTIRCYVKPMFWTQDSQLSGDTVYLQMRNKKLDNIELFPNAFIVNIEKKDSVHYNQVGGKKMRGFFKNDKLETMYTVGNAESIYFKRDSGKVTGMQRSLSSRIRVTFKNGQAIRTKFETKPENKYLPMSKVTEDDKLLKAFIWKPKDRPISKESIIPSRHKKPAAAKGKSGLQAPGGKPINGAAADSLKGHSLKGDSLKTDTTKLRPLKMTKDSVIKGGPIKAVKDSTVKTGSPATSPKAIKDTTIKTNGTIKAIKDTVVKTGDKLPAVKAVKDSTKKQ
ncbi:OstA-like protein [Mucilaginibacter pineti]|nr:OstA-like protein [Mucilaginibacter pineti]